MPEQPRDAAKTPEQLEKDAQQAEAQSAKADQVARDARSAADATQKRADDIAAGKGHELADALYGMAGGERPDAFDDRATADRTAFNTSIYAGDRAREAQGARERANEARRTADWAKRVIGLGLVVTGLALLAGGLLGVGNASGATPAASGVPAATAAASAAPGAPNRAPIVGPVKANLIPTDTFYSVEASDPDGDALTYRWSKSNPCGSFTFTGPQAVWGHPHPPCPSEPFHPGTIEVVVSDGHGNEVKRSYFQGSETGIGPTPAPLPTTTSRPANTATQSSTPTATPTPSSAPTTGGGPNVPLAGGGLVLAGAGAVLLRTQEKKKTCDREQAEEARTRAEMDAKKQRFDDIDRTRSARDFARSESAKADRAWQQAQHGAAIGYDSVTNQPQFGTSAKSQSAKAAYEKQQAAHDEAAIRQRSYDAKGGDAAWQQARTEYENAKTAHDAAADALAKCLESIAPPSGGDGGGTTTSGGTTTDGGGTQPPPTGPTGPSVATQPKTQTRLCTPGERTTVSTSTKTIDVPDPTSTKLLFEAEEHKEYIDLEEVLDTAETVKGGLSKAKSALDKLAPGVSEAMEPMGPIFDVYDKLTDAAIKGLRDTGSKLHNVNKTGTLKLHYRYDRYQLDCKIENVCAADGMSYQRVATCTKTYLSSDGADVDIGDNGQVIWDGSADSFNNQKAQALTRLWNSFNQRVRRAEQEAQAFRDACK